MHSLETILERLDQINAVVQAQPDEAVDLMRDRLGASATGAGQAEIEALRETLATLNAENEKLRDALKDAEVKQGEVK